MASESHTRDSGGTPGRKQVLRRRQEVPGQPKELAYPNSGVNIHLRSIHIIEGLSWPTVLAAPKNRLARTSLRLLQRLCIGNGSVIFCTTMTFMATAAVASGFRCGLRRLIRSMITHTP